MMKKLFLAVLGFCLLVGGVAFAQDPVATKTLLNVSLPTPLFTAIVTLVAYLLTLGYDKIKGKIPPAFTVFVPLVLGLIASIATGDWTYMNGGLGATTIDQVIKKSMVAAGVKEQTVSVPVSMLTSSQATALTTPK